jgi:hypothetical protein
MVSCVVCVQCDYFCSMYDLCAFLAQVVVTGENIEQQHRITRYLACLLKYRTQQCLHHQLYYGFPWLAVTDIKLTM